MIEPAHYKQQTEHEKRRFECQIGTAFQKVGKGKSNRKKCQSAGGIEDQVQHGTLGFRDHPAHGDEGFMAENPID